MKESNETTLKCFTREGFFEKVEQYMNLDKRTLAELLAFKDMLYGNEYKKWCPGIEAPSMLCSSTNSNHKIEGINISAQA